MPVYGCPLLCPRSTRWSPGRSLSVSPWWMRPLGDRSGFSPLNKSAASLGIGILAIFLLSACSHGDCRRFGRRSDWEATARGRGSSDPSFRRGWLLPWIGREASSPCLAAASIVMEQWWRSYGGLVAAEEEEKLGARSPSPTMWSWSSSPAVSSPELRRPPSGGRCSVFGRLLDLLTERRSSRAKVLCQLFVFLLAFVPTGGSSASMERLLHHVARQPPCPRWFIPGNVAANLPWKYTGTESHFLCLIEGPFCSLLGLDCNLNFL